MPFVTDISNDATEERPKDRYIIPPTNFLSDLKSMKVSIPQLEWIEMHSVNIGLDWTLVHHLIRAEDKSSPI